MIKRLRQSLEETEKKLPILTDAVFNLSNLVERAQDNLRALREDIDKESLAQRDKDVACLREEIEGKVAHLKKDLLETCPKIYALKSLFPYLCNIFPKHSKLFSMVEEVLRVNVRAKRARDAEDKQRAKAEALAQHLADMLGVEVKTNRLVKWEKNLTQQNATFEMCTFCYCSYEEGEKIVVLKCNHAFHRDCLVLWKVKRSDCPLCKRCIGYVK